MPKGCARAGCRLRWPAAAGWPMRWPERAMAPSRGGIRTPGALRRGGAGETIRVALADCRFGRLLVGATDSGVCFIGFAEPDDALLGDLQQRFPKARLVQDDQSLPGTG